MSSFTSISSEKLVRLLGTPACPVLIDVRAPEDFAADPRLIPGSLHRSPDAAVDLSGRPSVVICNGGKTLSQGAAALMRCAGGSADTLEGGFDDWKRAGLPLVNTSKLPARDAHGRTVWVTRSRPKVDRIACPWLIRRFVDPTALFLFVSPAEVRDVADQFGGAPFDVEGVFWTHRGDDCTFDLMVRELGLESSALLRLAAIVRGADTARPNLVPEAAGLLAASLGLSRMYADDLEQLEAGMLLYDAFYRWCRDATDETHNWPSHTAKRVNV